MGVAMSKQELVNRLRGYWPDLNPRRYPGQAGFKQLWAIWKRLERKRDLQTAREWEVR